jgi:hypothetical protein
VNTSAVNLPSCHNFAAIASHDDTMQLRPVTLADLDLLNHWDGQPHVIESDPNNDWHWEDALGRTHDWGGEQLIAELNCVCGKKRLGGGSQWD